MLNETDDLGSTPLHYAAKKGMLSLIGSMLQQGALLNAKNKEKKSPLHFAARYGRYNTCVGLLNSLNGPTTINDTDGEGRTSLHEASQSGHTRVVTLLLQRGAFPFRDVNGDTPIHLAAANGYTQTIKVLLEMHWHHIDTQNKNGNTPLHLAAEHGHENVVSMLMSNGAALLKNNNQLHFLDLAIKHEQKDVCVAIVSHDRWREVMDLRSSLYGCSMVGFIKFMPSVCQLVLDRCRISSEHDRKDPEFHFTYDFKYLQCERKKNVTTIPLYSLNMMVKFNRIDCLSHPVCVNFLRMKWCAYGMWVHLINLMVYLVFLISLTLFIITADRPLTPPWQRGQFVTAVYHKLRNGVTVTGLTAVAEGTEEATVFEVFERKHKVKAAQYVQGVVILSFCVLNMVKEVVQIMQQKKKYFTDIVNLFEWVLYVTAILFILPFLLDQPWESMWDCAAIAIFLAWFNLLLFLERFDFFGIYVVMFMEIMKTLLQVLTVFSIILVAFGLSFFILYYYTPDVLAFGSPLLSLMSVIVMMTGSIDYMENWLTPLSEGHHFSTFLTFALLLIFIFLIPILLVNLLIGLAVGDIEAIQRDAKLKRLATQVQYNTDLESKMPIRLLEWLDKNEWKLYPNKGRAAMQRIWNQITRTRGVAFDEENDSDLGVQHEGMDNQDYVYDMMNRQKKRLKQLSNDISKQYELIKLIVQKMEIHTEADEWDDEDVTSGHGVKSSVGQFRSIGWSSNTMRHTLIRQISVLNKWKRLDSDTNAAVKK